MKEKEIEDAISAQLIKSEAMDDEHTTNRLRNVAAGWIQENLSKDPNKESDLLVPDLKALMNQYDKEDGN